MVSVILKWNEQTLTMQCDYTFISMGIACLMVILFYKYVADHRNSQVKCLHKGTEKPADG